jgi:hypothetical protein
VTMPSRSACATDRDTGSPLLQPGTPDRVPALPSPFALVPGALLHAWIALTRASAPPAARPSVSRSPAGMGLEGQAVPARR